MLPSIASRYQNEPNPSETAHAIDFSLWLSSKERDAIRQRVEATNRRLEVGSGLVMIVDDEQVIAITLAEILRRQGINAVWFSEPLAALEYAQTYSIELLISDFTMPLMDGVLLATQVRKAVPACALFLLSAVCDQPEFMVRMKELGTDVHVASKPLQVDQLLSTVKRLLHQQPAPVA